VLIDYQKVDNSPNNGEDNPYHSSKPIPLIHQNNKYDTKSKASYRTPPQIFGTLQDILLHL